MGLGKTVELLACLLAHPFTPTHHAAAVKAELGSNKVLTLACPFIAIYLSRLRRVFTSPKHLSVCCYKADATSATD